MLELNLILVAMLRYAGLQADPVMLSTRDHGFSLEDFPVNGQFNYLVCRVRADEDDWLLDATHPLLGFGKLPYECYNGQARVLNREATLLRLSPDQLNESDNMNVEISLNKTGSPYWQSAVTHQYGFFASETVRKKIKKDGTEALRKALEVEEKAGGTLSELVVAPSDKPGSLLEVKYTINTPVSEDGLIYINPVLVSYFRQNPFKSAVRKYPVEFPYKVSQQYLVNIQVPDGYRVEEMPAALSTGINGNKDATFDYQVTEANGKITIRYSIDIAKTFFKPEEYKTLRDLFSKIAAKLEEQVVFKKQ